MPPNTAAATPSTLNQSPHPSFRRPAESYAKMTLRTRFCRWGRRLQRQKPQTVQSCHRSRKKNKGEVHAAQLVAVALLRAEAYQAGTAPSKYLRTKLCSF